jgi:hypothetical protein
MELESLEYKIVMEQGRDTEVLGRLANLYMATAAYMAAIARCPKRRNRNKSFVPVVGAQGQQHPHYINELC